MFCERVLKRSEGGPCDFAQGKQATLAPGLTARLPAGRPLAEGDGAFRR